MIYKVSISIQLLMDAAENKPDVEGLTRDIFDGIRGKDEVAGVAGRNAWQTRPNVRIIDYGIDSEKGDLMGYCDRCNKESNDLVTLTIPDFFSGNKPLVKKLCPSCGNKLYHWCKLECHRYECDVREG